MKASQLRAASHLIEALDDINHDIGVFDNKDKEKDFQFASVHAGKTKLRFRPIRMQYKQFLLERKQAVELLLKQMGVDVAS